MTNPIQGAGAHAEDESLFRSVLRGLKRLRAVMLSATILHCPVYAASSITVNITGTVTMPACIVNGNADINVSFGNSILTSDINGSNYAQNIPFTLSCPASGIPLRLAFQGTASSFDSSALTTSAGGLGIRILRPDGSALAPNEWFSFTYTSTPPSMRAVPVRNVGVSLPAGAFTSSAVLVVEVL